LRSGHGSRRRPPAVWQKEDHHEGTYLTLGAGGGSCIFLGGLAIRGCARALLRIGRGGEQELSDLGETAGGKESVEADLVEACGEHVLEKATHEFQGRKCDRLPASLPGVFVAEGDLTVFKGEDTVIGDGNPVDVAGEVGEHFLGALDRRFAIDHPWGVPH
jgi:hypothetical protein